MKVILFLSFFSTFLLFSQEKVAQLPKEIHESSALVKYQDVFISLNDSGNENALYVFDESGELLNKCVLVNTTNVDWEALAYDGETTLYIGDIGNNENKRNDQKIYSVSIIEVISKGKTEAKTIYFTYPD